MIFFSTAYTHSNYMIRNLGKCKLFGERSRLNISIYFHYLRTLHQKEWRDIEFMLTSTNKTKGEGRRKYIRWERSTCQQNCGKWKLNGGVITHLAMVPGMTTFREKNCFHSLLFCYVYAKGWNCYVRSRSMFIYSRYYQIVLQVTAPI